MAKKSQEGALLLEDGSLWMGIPFGAKTTKVGECVFHTGHQGYQEILTDPSYCRQTMIFSAPQIGNQGFADDDFESDRVWAAGMIARDYSEAPTHWRKQKSLDEVLKAYQTPALHGVDTRRLILHLRSRGSMWGVISTETSDIKKLQKFLRADLSMEGLSLTQEVTTSKAYDWKEGSHSLLKESLKGLFNPKKGYRKCVVMDFGVKRQILRYLIDAGFEEVRVVGARTKADDILALKPDVVLLSNGPGDPAAERDVIEQVKKLHGKVPLFGICLGHQILALSLGVQTYKLKFGHHAANHPVKNRRRELVEITSQNHGFAVPLENNRSDLDFTYINLNDQTVEGFKHRHEAICGIQFHPESSPGPLDSVEVFEKLQAGTLV
jgi:carbamoyl-phosphate synthase small subunit